MPQLPMIRLVKSRGWCDGGSRDGAGCSSRGHAFLTRYLCCHRSCSTQVFLLMFLVAACQQRKPG